jgi:hypothetical protein
MGKTYSIEGCLLTPSNFPQRRLKIFWVELEEGTHPSSIDCCPERSEESPKFEGVNNTPSILPH